VGIPRRMNRELLHLDTDTVLSDLSYNPVVGMIYWISWSLNMRPNVVDTCLDSYQGRRCSLG
jgi:hypothetical protein